MFDSNTEHVANCKETETEREKITPTGKELARYVQNLYDSGAKLWTKEMFLDIEAELAKEPKPHSVMIRSMNGAYRRKQVPQFADKGYPITIPYFKIYQTLVRNAEEVTSELDPDEEDDLDKRSSSDYITEVDKALATRALTLAGTTESSSTIEYARLKTAWDEAKQNWLQSTVCRDLSAILVNGAYNSKCIRKIVCFGLGSLEGPPDHSSLDALAPCDGLPRRRAITQHTAVLTMAAVLGERSGIDPLPILAQEPEYSSVAKRLLTEEGIQIVGGSGSLAFTHVDENTLVFSVSPNVPVKQIVADIARPAGMIWNRVQSAAEESTKWVRKVIDGEEVNVSPWSTDEDSPRTRTMVNDYIEFDFPGADDRFGGLKIYIRKEVATN